MRKVNRIVKLKLTELHRLRMKPKIMTLGRVFRAREVTLGNFKKTIIYREDHSENWIKITASSVIIFTNGRTRRIRYMYP